MKMTRRTFGGLLAGAGAGGMAGLRAERGARYRGFNLLEKFYFNGSHDPFHEDDFRRMRDWGFNFARLPMDYRGYVEGGDWLKFLEGPLRQIDGAVAYGEKYGIHVCLNLHRAPGYTVAQPAEKKDLWTDAEAQAAAAAHWAMFARRYRDVPSARLSFNLFNEPANIGEEGYLPVLRRVVETIREIDGKRPIWSDGLDWGRRPIASCRDLGVGMMTRGYEPFPLTHYQASWAGGERFPEPRWPAPPPVCGTLLSPSRPGHSFPLEISGGFPAGTRLGFRVSHVTSEATLSCRADGREIFRHRYQTGPTGAGEWKSGEWLPEWKTHRSVYDKEETLTVPAAARRLAVQVEAGDWMYISEISIHMPDGTGGCLALVEGWEKKPEPLRWFPAADGKPARLGPERERDDVLEQSLEPWLRFRREGGRFMAGEWGCYNRVPHAVMLAWAGDLLRLWKENDVGWALWNFRGPFGPLDSGRKDTRYEKDGGVLVDRAFLDLLRAG